ncbi:acyl-CoA dehydrogenase [Croceicoccus estronivorus]|uniref:acyl-CoA dehydrogenase family protein n=1 Tax=Croceicoccus estronivorus TaxID=1172626 RepID=UPI0008329B55|nr:acyl-CoA dehydrogenase family protein [Croceicoccus estronivorus]OCC23558.1 acyl-CoA dehydrogenase [Croceicoccus estronivorus]
MLPIDDRLPYGEEHQLFRETVRKLFARELLPNLDLWEHAGVVDRSFWLACGAEGLLCPQVPEQYGGLGLDYSYAAIVNEELWYAGSTAGLPLHTDVAVDYLIAYGSEEMKHKWLPKMVTGEAIIAIAMTEPGAGSDLQGIKTTARRDGDEYVLNGSKTYITNGQNADIVIVVAKTDATAGAKGISLILVEADRPGFARGRNLDKIGQHSADTSELFFEGVRVPVGNLIGNEGEGFGYLMSQLPQERLCVAIGAQAGAQRAFDEAVSFVFERKAFGRTVADFQNTKFVLAELATELQVGWAHIDWALQRHIEGKLDQYQGAAVKLWHTEMQWKMVDACLQLHGGAGYMNEYPIARLWRDARVQRIYGGTSEIMKVVVARSIAPDA